MMLSEVVSKIKQRFPLAAVVEPSPFKETLCVKVSRSVDYTGLLRMLEGELGFKYLDFLTAVDWKGPVDAKGYIIEPNPNVFLAEGAVLGVAQEPPSPGFPYRETFEIVAMISNYSDGLRIAVRYEIPRSNPRLPSLTGLWRAADWQERELYDLMGVIFEGHPRLKKILTPEFIQGHPLRKDYVHVRDQYD